MDGSVASSVYSGEIGKPPGWGTIENESGRSNAGFTFVDFFTLQMLPSMNISLSTNAGAAAEICIVGPGSSGIAVAKALAERNLIFDCFEKGSDIGGMWRYDNDNGLSSAYASLHIDSSRKNLGYSDFPIPDDLPDFLSHQQVLAYLEAYAAHFDLTKRVTFNTSVDKIWIGDDGKWRVRLNSGETRSYKTIIVANGHLSDPRWPSFRGHFDGAVIHSHTYRTAAPFEGKNVLVVGLGNSAVDIAVDLCRRAASVSISTRRSAWIMPKYLMGVPVDRWSAFLARRFRLPTRVIRMLMARLIRLAVGDQRRFGLKRPEHPMWREHATLSQELLPYTWARMDCDQAEYRKPRWRPRPVRKWKARAVRRDRICDRLQADVCFS